MFESVGEPKCNFKMTIVEGMNITIPSEQILHENDMCR